MKRTGKRKPCLDHCPQIARKENLLAERDARQERVDPVHIEGAPGDLRRGQKKLPFRLHIFSKLELTCRLTHSFDVLTRREQLRFVSIFGHTSPII